MGGCEDTAGGVPDRRQDERACTRCDGSGIRQFDSDGYEACTCLLTAASPVPDQQREAVAQWLLTFTKRVVNDRHRSLYEEADDLLSVVRGAEGGDRR